MHHWTKYSLQHIFIWYDCKMEIQVNFDDNVQQIRFNALALFHVSAAL